MTKRMLIDSTHAEETRVVVLDGNRLEDFDVETSTKQQLKGNIYLAKIVRVEPSLQAAFVEFGGGRHGFLAFGEIHPDYYQIPVADRKRLLELQEAEAREEEEEEEREALRRERGGRRTPRAPEPGADEQTQQEDDSAASEGSDEPPAPGDEPAFADATTEAGYAAAADPETADSIAHENADGPAPEPAMPRPEQVAQAAAISQDILVSPEEAHAEFPEAEPAQSEATPEATSHEAGPDLLAGHDSHAEPNGDDSAQETVDEVVDPAPHSVESVEQDDSVELIPQADEPENLGGELDTDDRQDRRTTPRFLRNYKIQEVIRRRQIMLVQVVKEERGTKGAALTTYISLAGRFSVLMPNSPRGGGISRKITSAADRRRLKEITQELELPRGMGLIVRTAGAARPKPEIIRDCEYLLNQWDQIRDLTMKSMAPALIYEEASLIKRAIRDVYSRDVDEILVDGEAGWRAARDFMRMLMPSHARKVQLWRDPQPLFAKAQVESQLDAMLQPTVQLRSGGYLVINQTEALVAIDVNSGRSTRERGIEETALRTNMEAAEEAARQLRLRDLAGLIVIDFIDMESRRNNASVERRLKDALRDDRARIQVGSISHFGLLEMSRQRLRPSLAETNFVPCPHCGGSGHQRSTESAALSVLRAIEDEGSKRRAAEVVVHVHGSIALYILNHKRVRLAEIEARYGMHVTFAADEELIPPQLRIERVRALAPSDAPLPISQLPPPEPFEDDDEVIEEEAPDEAPAPAAAAAAASEDEDDADRPGETPEEGEQRRKKRRRRRRGGRREDVPAGDVAADAAPRPEAAEGEDAIGEPASEAAAGEASVDPDAPPADGERKRRGRRGGRRRRRDGTVSDQMEHGASDEDSPAEDGPAPTAEAPADEPPAPVSPAYQPPAYQPPAYAPPPPPSYVGPTPANPFGGDSNAFSFFDAVEEAEAARIAAPKPAPIPEPMPAPEPMPTPEPMQATAPEPAAEASLEAEPEPTKPEATVIAPVVIDTPDAPPVEKKRGWWRA